MTKTNENKTRPTDVKVNDYLDGIEEKRQREAKVIIEMMKKISNLEPTMWGESIIGFGSESYHYETGRSGEVPKLAFSPRKAKLTFYFNAGFNEYGKELEKLGKYKTSVSCLYVNKLEDINLDVLNEMFKITWDSNNESKKIETVEDYVASVPDIAKKQFESLRSYVKSLLPEAKEVYSYGILGYKTDNRRAKVYISAFKDHLGMYPVPKNEDLLVELKPYIKGKGTLWFKLEDRLPKRLIKKIVLELIKA